MNRKNILVIILFYAISAHAASDELVVTKPYKPGIRERYSTCYKATLTATCALGGVCAYTNRANLGKTSCVLLGGASVAYLHQMMRRRSLLDMLLTDPEAALDRAHAVGDKCAKEGERTAESPERTKNLINKFTQQYPIFLLGECTKEDWGHCLLSRRYESKYRQEFESRVVRSLRNKAQLLERPVQYVGFGCGGIFQDHVILTKMLAQKPDAQLDVHLIDIKHIPYIKYRDLLDGMRSIDPQAPADPTSVMANLKRIVREDRAVPATMGDEELTRAIVNTCESIEAPARQSIAWLSKTFPHARLRLHIHDSMEGYYQHIERANIQSPDVIATADIQDEMSRRQSSTNDYAELCIRALQKNADADNIWLAKDAANTGAILMDIKIQEAPKSEKYDIKLKDASIVPAYITSQPIRTSSSFIGRLVRRPIRL